MNSAIVESERIIATEHMARDLEFVPYQPRLKEKLDVMLNVLQHIGPIPGLGHRDQNLAQQQFLYRRQTRRSCHPSPVGVDR